MLALAAFLLVSAGYSAVFFLSAGSSLILFALVWDHRHYVPAEPEDMTAEELEALGDEDIPPLNLDELYQHMFDVHPAAWAGLRSGAPTTVGRAHVRAHIEERKAAEHLRGE